MVRFPDVGSIENGRVGSAREKVMSTLGVPGSSMSVALTTNSWVPTGEDWAMVMFSLRKYNV